jgi:hypothetical protein
MTGQIGKKTFKITGGSMYDRISKHWLTTLGHFMRIIRCFQTILYGLKFFSPTLFKGLHSRKFTQPNSNSTQISGVGEKFFAQNIRETAYSIVSINTILLKIRQRNL